MEGREVVTRQVIGKHILPAGDVYGFYLETEPCLLEKEAADQVHHVLVPAGSPADCVDGCLVVPQPPYSEAPPAPALYFCSHEPHKELLERDVLGPCCRRPLQLEPGRP